MPRKTETMPKPNFDLSPPKREVVPAPPQTITFTIGGRRYTITSQRPTFASKFKGIYGVPRGYTGFNKISGWTITEVKTTANPLGVMSGTYIAEFVAAHPDFGEIRGNFSDGIVASSKEAFDNFVAFHPPTQLTEEMIAGEPKSMNDLEF